MALVDVEVVDANGNRCPPRSTKSTSTLPVQPSGAAASRKAPPLPSPQTSQPAMPTVTPPIPRRSSTKQLHPLEAPPRRRRHQPHHPPLNSLRRNHHPHSHRRRPQTRNAQTRIPHRPGHRGPLHRNALRRPDLLPQARPNSLHPSFKITRTALTIASATARSTSTTTSASYDDNETTGWSSDGELQNAWIEYTLASPDAIDELELKLNGFRQHRYALRITVDGATVWEGLAPTTLGYCTLPLKPTKGQHLRITLTDAPQDEGLAAGSKEITGKVEVSGIAPVTKNKPTLNIIETEIYKTASDSKY